MTAITDILQSRARVRRLTAELGIVSDAITAAMLDDPGRAVRVLDRAKTARGIRDRAAFAVGMWRNGWGLPAPVLPPPVSDFDEGGPPSLSALEYAWSRGWGGRDDHAVGDALLYLMAAALAKHGGFRQLQAHMRTVQRYDDEGELLA
jgi:hypothetical protein